MDEEYSFELLFKVRDYECDLQGIVNNAVYQNYLEHTRHMYLEQEGVSFISLHNEDIDGVVVRIEIDYKYPLRSGDEFFSRLNVVRSGHIRFVFNQDIYRKSDNKLIVKAKVTTVCINTKTGKPVVPTKLEKLFVN